MFMLIEMNIAAATIIIITATMRAAATTEYAASCRAVVAVYAATLSLSLFDATAARHHPRCRR